MTSAPDNPIKTLTPTRKKNTVYLIGQCELNSLKSSCQLPAVKQTLQRFHHFLKESKSVHNAAHDTCEELCFVWGAASIPIKKVQHCIEKLEKYHNEWLLIKKNKGRRTEMQQKRENCFMSNLDKLFDIAHEDALHLIKVEEDKTFLVDQRGDRIMFMDREDLAETKMAEKALQRKQQEQKRIQREKERQLREREMKAECSTTLDSHTSDGENEEVCEDEEFKASAYISSQTSSKTPKPEKIQSKQLLTPDVTAALDRNKTTDREAVRLLLPFASALGQDPDTLSISRNTINRTRKKARMEHAHSLKNEYRPDFPLIVHWDGKMLPQISGKGTVDRLAIVVTGDGTSKLLGVPKLEAGGTGKNMAKSVYSLLQDWDILDNIQGMSFDTTSSNTGNMNGACTILERMMGRELLWFACRHHVFEIVLAKIFSLCFGPSNSPEIPIFKRFKAVWEGVTQSNFKGLELEDNECTRQLCNESIIVLKQAMKSKQIRDDYNELYELALVVLGEQIDKIHWRTPGPVHHARWMAKLIYALKIFLFREQEDVFKLTKREQKQLKRFVMFGVFVYVKAWAQATLAADAPVVDLEFIKDLQMYETIDEEIARQVSTAFDHHRWYLSDELVALALFSNKLPASEKEKLVNSFQKPDKARCVRGNKSNTETIDISLHSFASKKSATLLDRLHISKSFLSIPLEEWEQDMDFVKGKQIVQELSVVNDCAERGVKLFADFNLLLTKSEEEKEFLLQVVEHNRKQIPTATKKAIVKSLNKQ